MAGNRWRLPMRRCARILNAGRSRSKLFPSPPAEESRVGTAQQALPRTALCRTLRLRDLIFYGLIVIQPTAPMTMYGVVSQEARGHVVTTILFAMIAMLLTAVSYGRMARVYPSAGSAYAYMAGEFGSTA